MALGAVIFTLGHAPPVGPIGMGLFLVGISWAEFRGRRAAYDGPRHPARAAASTPARQALRQVGPLVDGDHLERLGRTNVVVDVVRSARSRATVTRPEARVPLPDLLGAGTSCPPAQPELRPSEPRELSGTRMTCRWTGAPRRSPRPRGSTLLGCAETVSLMKKARPAISRLRSAQRRDARRHARLAPPATSGERSDPR